MEAPPAQVVPKPGSEDDQESNDSALAGDMQRRKDDERRPWTKLEDSHVLALVGRYGTKKWSAVGSHLQGRTGKQCRER